MEDHERGGEDEVEAGEASGAGRCLSDRAARAPCPPGPPGTGHRAAAALRCGTSDAGHVRKAAPTPMDRRTALHRIVCPCLAHPAHKCGWRGHNPVD
jgi:hypothetical protein